MFSGCKVRDGFRAIRLPVNLETRSNMLVLMAIAAYAPKGSIPKGKENPFGWSKIDCQKLLPQRLGNPEA